MFGSHRDIVTRVVLREKTPCLVAAFRNSTQPIVWHIPLSGTPRLALTMRSEEGGWIVCLREEGCTSSMEAHFLGRGDAELAYESLRKSMMRCSFVDLASLIRWGLLLVIVAGSILFVTSSTSKEGVKPTATKSVVVQPSVTKQPEEQESLSLKDQEIMTRDQALKDFENSRPAVADDVLPAIQD